MTNRRLKVTLAALAVAMLCLLAFTGCSGASGNASGNTTASPTAAQNTNPSASNTANESASATANTGPSPATSATTNTEPADPAPVPTAEGTLRVRFIDVGQGDCAIVSCNGHHLLVDGGPRDASRKVYAILSALGITRLDAVIATHADADHTGGISGALSFATTGACYCSVTSADTKTFQSLVSKLESQGVGITVPRAGDSFDLGGATVTFVGPTATFSDDNNSSLVARIDFGATSFLLAADAETDAESAMLRSKANLDADVLKVAHHGSKNATGSSFLRAVSPSYAVVSVGSNSYGHPADATLGRLASAGAQVLRTDQSGSIVFTSDGTTLTVDCVTQVTE